MTASFAPRGDDLRQAQLLLVPGVIGVITGGLIAAAVAHAPTSAMVWLVAYLVLVVGVAQLALAIGQALLTSPAVGTAQIRFESLLFNLGSAGVMAGTVGGSFPLVVAGALLFFGALGAFLFAVHGIRRGYAAHAYRALIAFLAISALVGLLLSARSV
ncbi:MAG: hypothetical protein U5K73_01890 [Halofilum sp. (in: g-proteobacteria)]|nr:hypothetical protein [Halofilum sp. (in: g-proteobacteria)]